MSCKCHTYLDTECFIFVDAEVVDVYLSLSSDCSKHSGTVRRPSHITNHVVQVKWKHWVSVEGWIFSILILAVAIFFLLSTWRHVASTITDNFVVQVYIFQWVQFLMLFTQFTKLAKFKYLQIIVALRYQRIALRKLSLWNSFTCRGLTF